MKAVILRRLVNSAVWIVSGIVVIIVRAFVAQSGLVMVWEIIGGAMIIFGAGRIAWTLIKNSSDTATSV